MTVATISCTSGWPGSTDAGRPCSTWPCPRTRNYARSKGDRCPMLCLHDSIRHNDPAVQRLLSALEHAPYFAALILAAWQVARVLTVHLVEAVLAERAQHPKLWPCCPQCGAGLRSKGFAKRQITSLFGPIQWRRRIGRCPRGC